MKLEHVVQKHYDKDGFPVSESHFIKINDELFLIGCNGVFSVPESDDYGEIADWIVEAVNEKAGEQMKIIAIMDVYQMVDPNGHSQKRLVTKEFEVSASLNDVWQWGEENGLGGIVNITLCKAGD